MPYLPDDYGFRIISVMRGDRMAPVARYVCGCGATHDQVVHSGKVLNPEMIAKRAARDGWQVMARRASKILCPACLGRWSEAAKGESGAKASALPAPLPSPKPALRAEEITMASSPPAPGHAAPRPSSAVPTTEAAVLTVKQRFDARQYLDKHFDDENGRYLDDWSDHKIAEALRVPRLLVERFREVAYGPLRTDPELIALKNLLSACEGKLEQLSKDHAAALASLQEGFAAARGEIDTAIGGLRARIAAYERKAPA